MSGSKPAKVFKDVVGTFVGGVKNLTNSKNPIRSTGALIMEEEKI